MADQYTNKTGLQYFWNRIKTVFATKAEIPTATSDLTNDGDGDSPFATQDYADAHGGAIDVVKQNGNALPITDKAVNVTVPTKTSDITNDSGFQTASEVESAINAKVASAVNYAGTVATYDNLPSNAAKGDLYDVADTGMNYVWDGTKWDAMGTLVDTSILWAKADLTAITTAEIDAITV